MVSAREGWAVGFDDDPSTGEHPLLLHYTAGAWSPVHLPIFDQPRVELKSIAMLPSGEGWAVGGMYADTGQQSIVLHYSRGSWTPQETGVPAQLNSVVALSPTDAWAVGTKDIAVGPGVIVHYIGGKWSAVASPTPNLLHTVVMRSATALQRRRLDEGCAGDPRLSAQQPRLHRQRRNGRRLGCRIVPGLASRRSADAAL